MKNIHMFKISSKRDELITNNSRRLKELKVYCVKAQIQNRFV